MKGDKVGGGGEWEAGGGLYLLIEAVGAKNHC